MSPISCLGFFTVPIINSPISDRSSVGLRDAVFHRGRTNVHVLCSNYERVGDVAVFESQFIGPLVGDVGSISEPLSPMAINSDCGDKKIYLRLFYVHIPMEGTSTVHGFLFSRSQCVSEVRQVFSSAQIQIKHIPSYQSSHFYGVPQVTETSWSLTPADQDQPTIRGCKTKLMDHQLRAVKFLERSESACASIPLEIWRHPDNEWVRQLHSNAAAQGHIRAAINFDAKGCILADDMGLGKTLTTLTTIQLSSQEAHSFANHPTQMPEGENVMRTSATLIICPLSTLDNWKNEIEIHFHQQSLPYRIFHGKQRLALCFEEIRGVAVVLATYESISSPARKEDDRQGESGSQQPNARKNALDLSRIEWFRIVLDEAQ